MEKLTPEGQRVVAELAEKHGFSEDAIAHMLIAVLYGNGAMAQFNHPEFSGSGQWMRGGMLMLSDMFNHALKARVDALCSEMGEILAREPGLLQSGSIQSQRQSSGSQHQGGVSGGSSLFVADASGNWWPRELGQPSATGSQDGVRYAYFAPARRLAVEVGGQVRVYDTLDHRIGGFAQQQGGGTSVTFTSQHGMVSLSSLPDVSALSGASPSQRSNAGTAEGPPGSGSTEDVFSAIERLGKLRQEGLITEDEFAEKKAELLRRI